MFDINAKNVTFAFVKMCVHPPPYWVKQLKVSYLCPFYGFQLTSFIIAIRGENPKSEERERYFLGDEEIFIGLVFIDFVRSCCQCASEQRGCGEVG